MPAVKRHRQDGPASRKRAPAKTSRAPRRRSREASGWGMKLGAWAHAHMRQAAYSPNTGKLVMAGLGATFVVLFVVIAALTGRLTDMRNGINDGSANMARAAGFGVTAIDVATTNQRPLTVFQQSEARAVAALPFDSVMFTVKLDEIRNRVATLPWVEGVAVRRLWPDTVQIVITPREAVAAWQNDGVIRLIDAQGKVVTTASAAQARGLPLVIGAGASIEAPLLFSELKVRPQVAGATWAAEYTGNRRWTLKLRSGAEVLLPEENMGTALDTLEVLQLEHKVLNRQIARLDMRTPGNMILRPLPEVAAATNGA